VSPVVLSLWPQFEPFGEPSGVERVPRFEVEQDTATRKNLAKIRVEMQRPAEPAGVIQRVVGLMDCSVYIMATCSMIQKDFCVLRWDILN
jgi:hypothetical protein